MFLILFSGLTVSFSTHYCGGAIAASKVSLTGELANCGMENPVNNKKELIFASHCCDDVTSLYSIGNDYVHSVLNFEGAGIQVLHLFELPGLHAVSDESSAAALLKNKRPPGLNNPNSVNREAICIFRI